MGPQLRALAIHDILGVVIILSFDVLLMLLFAGKPTRFSDVRVIIKVGRQTNKAPRFLHKSYITQIYETAQPGLLDFQLYTVYIIRMPKHIYSYKFQHSTLAL